MHEIDYCSGFPLDTLTLNSWTSAKRHPYYHFVRPSETSTAISLVVVVEKGKLRLWVFFRYSHVNYLFCNAGILSAIGIRWSELFWLFLSDPIGLFETSVATLQATGEINEDGMGTVFAANVFGHYVMVLIRRREKATCGMDLWMDINEQARELEPLLNASGDGRVIWTSSVTAHKKVFDIDDWQGIKR